MIRHLISCLLFAFSLLLLTADGRKYVEGINVTTSSTSSVNSNNHSMITTHPNDVMGLMKLINEFPQLSGVQFPSVSKDPCSPHKLTWISCRNESSVRRVTALYLRNKNLHGPIPDFSSMDALETIDLQENFLSGTIPAFFTSFPKLKYLNLANNSITVPLSVSESVSNTKKIKFRSLVVAAPSYCTSYPYLCTCIYPYTCAPPSLVYSYIPPPASGGTQFPMPDPTDFNYRSSGYGKTNKPSKLPKILGISIPSGLVAAVGGGCCIARRRNRQAAAAAAAPPPPLLPPSPVCYPTHNYNINRY